MLASLVSPQTNICAELALLLAQLESFLLELLLCLTRSLLLLLSSEAKLSCLLPCLLTSPVCIQL